jgi:hypothetical protein
MTSAEVVRFERTGVALVDRAVFHWGQANLCPRAYRIGHKEDGATDWPNLVIAASSCAALTIDPMLNLAKTYVIHGTFGMMAELQVALAQREGVDITDVSSSNTEATVCIRLPGEGAGERYTVTMPEATKAGWAGRNPNYQTMPNRMLRARATTLAIARRAPGVLRGIALRVAPIAALDPDMYSAGVALAPTAPVATPPAEYQTREAPEAMRAEVLRRLADLEARDPDAAAELRREWKALRGPVIAYDADTPEGRRAYLPDVLVLRYFLDETEGDASGVAEVDGPTPAEVLDDTPESRGMDPDAQPTRYDPDDAGRPF